MLHYIRETEEKDINWFLDTVICRDIKSVIDNGGAYLAFGLIAQAIEVLGALLDEKEFDDHTDKTPSKRFSLAICKVFRKINPKYNEFAKRDHPFDLWTHLRCGMAHVMRPNSNIVFSAKNDAEELGSKHLDKIILNDAGTEKECLLLVIEDFYGDLLEACDRVKKLAKKKTHPKLNKGYLVLYDFEGKGDGGNPVLSSG